MTERAATHAFALLNASMIDALIASHEAKFHYWLIRPSQADPAIGLAVPLPNFPAYPSNHAAVSAAAADILSDLFAEERSDLTRMADEAALSRVYGGIHFFFDATAGLALGRSIAVHARDVDRAGRLLAVLR